jgi:hypothetical protein
MYIHTHIDNEDCSEMPLNVDIETLNESAENIKATVSNVYVYMDVCIYAYICICIYTYVCKYKYIYIYIRSSS